MNVWTEVTKSEACLATVAICEADGLVDSPLTVLVNESSDDLIAVVSLGKSLLAELTSDVADVWIFWSCASSPLSPLLAVRLVSPLIEFSRLVRSEQYAGLLLPHPVIARHAIATMAKPSMLRRMVR